MIETSRSPSHADAAVRHGHPNSWVDLDVAADYAGVPVRAIVNAVTAREIRAVTSHPDQPGDWMVPLSDIDDWWRRRQLRGAVFG